MSPCRQAALVIFVTISVLAGGQELELPPRLVAPQPESTTGQTVEYFEALALTQNPAIAEADTLIRAAHGRWLQAGLAPNPTIGYVAAEMGNEQQAGQQGGFLGRSFITGDKLTLNRAIVCRDIERLEQNLEVTRQRVLTDVRRAFCQLRIIQSRIEVLTRFTKSLQHAVDVSRRLVEAGETGKTDLLLVEVESAQTQLELEQLHQRFTGKWREFAQIIGVVELPIEPLQDDPQGVPELSWDTAVGLVLGTTPVLSASEAVVRRQRASLRRAQAEVIPDISAQVSVQYDDATKDTVAGVQVSAPWPLWNRNQGGIQEARASLQAAHIQKQRLQRRIYQELAAEFAQYQNGQIQVKRYFDEILPKASEAQFAALAAYVEGDLGMSDVLNAQRAARQANLRYLDAQQQLRLSYENIRGFLVRDSLQTNLGDPTW